LYSILTALLTAILVLFVVLGEKFFRGIIRYNSIWAIIFAVFIIALIFQPLRDKIQGVVDKLFFKTKYDYRNTLKMLSHTSVSIINLDQLFTLVVKKVCETLKVNKASVYILGEDECFFERRKSLRNQTIE